MTKYNSPHYWPFWKGIHSHSKPVTPSFGIPLLFTWTRHWTNRWVACDYYETSHWSQNLGRMANHSFRWISWMKICAFREEFPFKKYSGSWIMTLCYCLTLGVPGRRIRLVCEKKVNHLDVPLHRSHVKPGQQNCWIVYSKTSPAKYRRFCSGLDVLHLDLHSLNWQDTINNSCRLLSNRNQKGVNLLLGKMASILQMPFPNTFLWMKRFIFWYLF